MDTAEHHYETIIRVIQAAAHYTHWPTLIGAAFALMFGLKKISPKDPQCPGGGGDYDRHFLGFGFHAPCIGPSCESIGPGQALIREFNPGEIPARQGANPVQALDEPARP